MPMFIVFLYVFFHRLKNTDVCLKPEGKMRLFSVTIYKFDVGGRRRGLERSSCCGIRRHKNAMLVLQNCPRLLQLRPLCFHSTRRRPQLAICFHVFSVMWILSNWVTYILYNQGFCICQLKPGCCTCTLCVCNQGFYINSG